MGWAKSGTLANAEAAGIIHMYGGVTAPAGYLLCDGSLVSRTGYAALFAAIGTQFGAGDGSTTFALPPMNGCFPRGGSVGVTGGTDTHAHGVGSYGLPAHAHGSAAHSHTSAAHAHASAAHSHTLSNAGWAQFYVSAGGGIAGRSRSVTAWTDNASASVGSTSTAISRTSGSSLDGATDSATPAATGTTTPGATGLTTPGATDPASPAITGSSDVTTTLPPYVGVNFIIKT